VIPRGWCAVAEFGKIARIVDSGLEYQTVIDRLGLVAEDCLATG
jgi:hypothetical protein